MNDKLIFNVKIKGMVPLLMARFPEEDWQKGQPKKQRGAPDPLPEEQYEKSLYKLDDGSLYLPAAHIIGSMVKAGSRFPLKGRQTYKEVCEGGVFIFPEKIPHLLKEVEMDYRSAVNQNTGGRIMTARGRLNKWEVSFRLECWDDRAQEDVIKNILVTAGSYIGVGAYRPRYGRFEVVEWKKVKN